MTVFGAASVSYPAIPFDKHLIFSKSNPSEVYKFVNLKKDYPPIQYTVKDENIQYSSS